MTEELLSSFSPPLGTTLACNYSHFDVNSLCLFEQFRWLLPYGRSTFIYKTWIWT